MVYDIFGQLVADYLGSSGSTLQRENIYRGGQLLAVYETAGSCTKSISAFVDAFYSGVNYTPTTTERNNAITTLTQAQSQGQGQLIAAAQALGASLFTSSNYTNTNPEQFVTDLYWAYLQRTPDSPGHNFWSDQITVYGSTWANVRQGFALSTEFQELVAGLCVSTSSTSANLKYVLTDVQGTTRAVMNNNGGSSVVLARHDYLPFGEELWAGIGSRTLTQTYGATDAVRQKYGLTERDDATGLDHTWWRKYESFSGRWTSPDPLNGSIADPQSFNSLHLCAGTIPLTPLIQTVYAHSISIFLESPGKTLRLFRMSLRESSSLGATTVIFGHPEPANGGSMNLSLSRLYTVSICVTFRISGSFAAVARWPILVTIPQVNSTFIR